MQKDADQGKDNDFALSGSTVGGVPRVSGIKAKSPPNKVVSQRPAAGSFATTGRCVRLKELYFGCTTANVQGAANLPVSCLPTLTSFDGKGKQNGEQKETYKPNNPTFADLMKLDIELPPARVVQINATILPLDQGNLATALQIDEVTYTQYDGSDAGVKACGAGS